MSFVMKKMAPPIVSSAATRLRFRKTRKKPLRAAVQNGWPKMAVWM